MFLYVSSMVRGVFRLLRIFRGLLIGIRVLLFENLVTNFSVSLILLNSSGSSPALHIMLAVGLVRKAPVAPVV